MNVRRVCRERDDASLPPKTSARVTRRQRAAERAIGASNMLIHSPRMAGTANEGSLPIRLATTPLQAGDVPHGRGSAAWRGFVFHMVPRIAVSLTERESMRHRSAHRRVANATGHIAAAKMRRVAGCLGSAAILSNCAIDGGGDSGGSHGRLHVSSGRGDQREEAEKTPGYFGNGSKRLNYMPGRSG